MKLRIGALLACMLAVGTAHAATQVTQSPKTTESIPLVIGRIAAPKIDGKVGQAEWKSAGVIPAFVNIADGKAPKAATKAYVGYDDKCLYIGVVCSEPMMNKVAQKKVTTRDADIWTNECIEVYVNPTADRISFFHFISDILGQKFDALGNDPYGYNPEWSTASFKGDKYWSSEIAIPFSSISMKTPKPGDRWYGLIGRERQAVGELSASKPTFGAFDAIGRYGEWVFDSLKTSLQRDADNLYSVSKKWPAGIGSDGDQWKKHLHSFQTKLAAMNETGARSSYGSLVADLDSLKKELAPINNKAARISAGGQAILITKAFPYQPFTDAQIAEGEKLGPMDITLLQDEWKDMAFNVSNLSEAPVTLRFTTRHGNQNQDFAYLGLRGVETIWQQAYPV
ncbi:MAG TPA: sugar-binding protein, partial [Armatimonadota bacterium]